MKRKRWSLAGRTIYSQVSDDDSGELGRQEHNLYLFHPLFLHQTIIQSLEIWTKYGTNVKQIWNQYETNMKQIWNKYEINLGGQCKSLKSTSRLLDLGSDPGSLGNIIFTAYVGYFWHFVISYIRVFVYTTVGNISFDVLGPWAFQKYYNIIIAL